MSTHYCSSLKISFGMFELDLRFLPKGANRIKESKCESWEFRSIQSKLLIASQFEKQMYYSSNNGLTEKHTQMCAV